MNRGHLIERVSERAGVEKLDASRMLDIIFAEMADALRRGEKVDIEDLLTLSVKESKTRSRPNPKTGELITTQGWKAIRAKAGKKLLRMLNPREASIVPKATSISLIAREPIIEPLIKDSPSIVIAPSSSQGARETAIGNISKPLESPPSEKEKDVHGHLIFKELEDEVHELTPDPSLWLVTPHGMLGGQSPMQLALSSAGGNWSSKILSR
jgi:nucleoid DNA-binding protein